jgi:hypothetical protein
VHVEGVVPVLDRHDDALEWTDETAGLRQLAVLRGRDLERVGHGGIAVHQVGQAPRLVIVEAHRASRRRPQVQRAQGIDLSGVRNRGDPPEQPFRLLDAGAVVGLDAGQIELDDTDGRDASGEERRLDIGDGRFFDAEWRCGARVPRLGPWRERQENHYRAGQSCRGE